MLAAKRFDISRAKRRRAATLSIDTISRRAGVITHTDHGHYRAPSITTPRTSREAAKVRLHCSAERADEIWARAILFLSRERF